MRRLPYTRNGITWLATYSADLQKDYLTCNGIFWLATGSSDLQRNQL